MGSLSYDELVNSSVTEDGPDVPFWALKDPYGDKPGEEDKLKWLRQALAASLPRTQQRANNQLVNLCQYKGIHFESQDPFADFRDPNGVRYHVDTTKITVQDVNRYVEQTSAKLTRFRSTVLVNPDTNEHSDKQGARVARKAIESHDTASGTGPFLSEVAKRAMLFGYQPILVYWDKCRGPISSRWREAKRKYKDEKKKLDGWTYEPNRPERMGEVWRRAPLPWEITFGPAKSPETCEWIMVEESVHIEQLKHEYKHDKDILSRLEGYDRSKLGVVTLNLDLLTTFDEKNHVKLMHFFHRSSEYAPGGRYIKWIDGVILEDCENELACAEVIQDSVWGDLPVEVFTDVDVPGHFFGMSSLQLIKTTANTRSKILTMMNRNLMLLGHPKIFAHRRAKVQASDFANNTTIVEWDGMVEPSIKTFATIPPELVGFYELLGGEQDKTMKTHPISSGEPPAGIKAGVALRLLEQLEDLLMTNVVNKQNEFVIAYARKRLALMGLKYKQDDGRFLRLMGADNEDIVETFDVEALAESYNFKVEHANIFSRNPAARAQQVIDFLEVKPDAMTNEQALDALELTRPEKITDPAQAAVSAAEWVNEQCAQNLEIPAPRPGDHFLVRWPIHMAFYQRVGFNQLPEKAQKRFLDYMLGLEFLMSEQARINPTFAARVFAIPGFPAFYHLPPDQTTMLQQGMTGAQAMGPGQLAPQAAEQLVSPQQQMQTELAMTPQ